MKGISYSRYGSADVLEYSNLQKPVIKPNEVLVKVHASSVNPIDWKIRKGDLKLVTGRKFPRLTGADFAGTVSETGSKVSAFKSGDEIYGMVPAVKGGACAEYLAVSVGGFYHKPANISFEAAAAIPLAATTALQALRDKGKLSRGQHILINGAAGGVGSFAVQIAKAYGARVKGVCSTKNLTYVKELGADDVIDYTSSNPWEINGKYDIIFDAVATGTFRKARHLLTPKGRYITTVPTPAGFLTELITRTLNRKSLRNLLVKASVPDLEYLKELCETGGLKAMHHKTFPLQAIREAHLESESGRVRGKIVLKIS
ncbi:MAG: NAD(P)-dependent alcohol dehydrogenase [FCB group bacterium]|nr:NAD(P)-dependent alcohol dehydrogenase [FCB group bacterium]